MLADLSWAEPCGGWYWNWEARIQRVVGRDRQRRRVIDWRALGIILGGIPQEWLKWLTLFTHLSISNLNYNPGITSEVSNTPIGSIHVVWRSGDKQGKGGRLDSEIVIPEWGSRMTIRDEETWKSVDFRITPHSHFMYLCWLVAIIRQWQKKNRQLL